MNKAFGTRCLPIIKKRLESSCSHLKWEFTNETTLNANDKAFLSEGNTLLLNTLEEADNPIRSILQWPS